MLIYLGKGFLGCHFSGVCWGISGNKGRVVLYIIGVIFIVLGDSLYIVGNNFIKIRNQIF